MLKFWRENIAEPKEQSFAFSPSEDPIFMGLKAQEAMDNPSFNAAFDRIEKDITHAWKTSAPKDKEAREHLYYRIEVLAEIKLKLQGMINNMKFEQNKQRQADQKATQGD